MYSDIKGWLLDNHFIVLYGCPASILTATMLAGQVFKRCRWCPEKKSDKKGWLLDNH
jgi:hypothetical protein